MTGVLNSSARLKACTASSKHSFTEEGMSAMTFWSPCRPHRSCITSDWAGFVARPTQGPDRCTLMTTPGISMTTAVEMFSCIRENPGPLVAVKALAPAAEAPMMAAMLPISSSICTNIPPVCNFPASRSATR
jgi:hypothetical protein